jgi:hypothetical protein
VSRSFLRTTCKTISSRPREGWLVLIGKERLSEYAAKGMTEFNVLAFPTQALSQIAGVCIHHRKRLLEIGQRGTHGLDCRLRSHRKAARIRFLDSFNKRKGRARSGTPLNGY